MAEYILRLNENDLHTDLQTIRGVRCGIKSREQWVIRLLWQDERGDSHQLPVCVEGPALSVKGVITKAGQSVDFFGENSDLYNYKKSDKGVQLWLSQITAVLENLESGKVTSEMLLRREPKARVAYVMCVFVASEIVRNEVLEKLLLKATEDNIYTGWSDYIMLYKKWASTSCALYGGDQNENAKIVMFNDIQRTFQAGTLRDDIVKLYEDILTGILA